uniref:Uncharacterized protein n=1 Tax=Anguilla anguilla TaxID=7936 RepID=A0A0E9WBL3_ANGAN
MYKSLFYLNFCKPLQVHFCMLFVHLDLCLFNFTHCMHHRSSPCVQKSFKIEECAGIPRMI